MNGRTENLFRGNVTQKAVVRRPDGDVLLVRSTDRTWEIPGGRIEVGERTDEALRRELREETGLEAAVGPPVSTHARLWRRSNGDPVFAVVYRCDTPGGEVTLNEEHDDYEWLPPTDATEEVDESELAEAIERAVAVGPVDGGAIATGGDGGTEPG